MAQRGVYLLRNGQPLRSYRANPALTADVVLEELRGDGFVGHLEDSSGLRLAHNDILDGGESYNFVEKAGLNWYQQHERLPTASSLASDPSAMRRYLGGDEPIYDLGRTSATIPLELTVEAFALYVQNLKLHILNESDWSFVCDVMGMSKFFENEKQREDAFASCIDVYLRRACPGVQFKLTQSVKGKSMPHIRIEALIHGEWITIVLGEVKLEMGTTGETRVEVMKYYGDHTSLLWKMKHWLYQRSCCPVLMLEIAGSHVRVGGAVRYLDRPAHQLFTPYLHVLKFLQDESHFSVLARALGSIADTVKSLLSFYDGLTPTTLNVRGAELEWPYLITQRQQQGATIVQSMHQQAGGALRTMNIGRSQQLLFGVQMGTQRRILKFSQRYGANVHQQWAAEGFAPGFTFRTLAGGWFMIDMEVYSPDDGWFTLFALDPTGIVLRGNSAGNEHRLQSLEAWEECKRKVIEAYRTLRHKFPGVVHGDLRKANIMYNIVSNRVAFIDFDWSGLEGQVNYPLLVNPIVIWPEGVGPCKPMKVEHDRKLLAMELGVAPDDIVPWLAFSTEHKNRDTSAFAKPCQRTR